MPVAAGSGLQEPDHELAVVRRVQNGSINSTSTKAQLTVKLPGRQAQLHQQTVLLAALTATTACPGYSWSSSSWLEKQQQQQQQQINICPLHALI
jgi:hypothetical protein